MLKAVLPILAVSSLAAAGTVQAQVQTPYGPDNGYFRPAPDVSLTRPREPQGGAAPQAAAPPQYVTIQAQPVQPAQPLPAPPRNPALEAQRDAERQMDRSLEESERERNRMQSTSAGVGAAFDGLTSEQNR